jgi:tetratricopeptide (TPR) repeat protein
MLRMVDELNNVTLAKLPSRTDAAIAMLELNGEFNPTSGDIEFLIAELHRTRGERDQAIARYRAALAKAPQHQGAKQRLSELEKQP